MDYSFRIFVKELLKMMIGANVVAAFMRLINHVISKFRIHPPTMITQECTEVEKITQECTEVEKITQECTEVEKITQEVEKITQEATEVKKTPKEATTAELLPNYTQLVTTNQKNLLNRAVSLNEAQSHPDVSHNNADCDNIAYSSYDNSLLYQEPCSDHDQEFIVNNTDINTEVRVKRKNGYDRKKNKYCPDRKSLIDSNYGNHKCLKDDIDWLKDRVQGPYSNTCAIHCIFIAGKISQGMSWEDIQKEYSYLKSCHHKDDKAILYLVNANILLRNRIDDSSEKICEYYKKNGLTKKKLDKALMLCLDKKLLKKPYFRELLHKNNMGKILYDYPPAIYFLYDDGLGPMHHVTLLATFIKGEKPLYFNSNGGCDDLSLYCKCDKCREDSLHILDLKKSVKTNPRIKFETEWCEFNQSVVSYNSHHNLNANQSTPIPLSPSTCKAISSNTPNRTIDPAQPTVSPASE